MSDTSHVFPAVMRHIQHLHLRQSLPVSYILENVLAAASFPDLSDSLGPPLIGHAELHGSASRRSTAFWTNAGARAPTQRSLDTSSATWTAADLLRDTSFGLDYTSSEFPLFSTSSCADLTVMPIVNTATGALDPADSSIYIHLDLQKLPPAFARFLWVTL